MNRVVDQKAPTWTGHAIDGSAEGGAMVHALWLISCDEPERPLVEEAAILQRALTVQVILTASDPVENGNVKLRLRGVPSTTHSIVAGDPGDLTTDTENGILFDLGSAEVIASPTTDADGWASVEVPETAGYPFVDGVEVAFQAGMNDGTDHLSRVVVREGVVVEDPPFTPNILILLADDMGIDRMTQYEKGDAATDYLAVTPELDTLATLGVRFENAWSGPMCGPTRSSLQTGRLPRRTGWGENAAITTPNSEWPPEFAVDTDVELDGAAVTLAELVKLSPWAAYQTSYVGKWQLNTPWGPSADPDGFVEAVHQQGWDWFQGTMVGLEYWSDDPANLVTPRNYTLYGRYLDDGSYVVETTYATTLHADDAIDRIVAMDAVGDPWLLQVAFNAPHSPFHTPPANYTTTVVDANTAHRAAIEAMDYEIGRILDEIDLDETLVFFFADNGSAVDSAGATEVPSEMKNSLFEGGVRVPLLVAGPIEVVAASEVNTETRGMAHAVDFFSTIADILDFDLATLPSVLNPADPLVIDGVSLVSLLDGSSNFGLRKTMYTERFSPGGGGAFTTDLVAIRNGAYKLIYDATIPGPHSFYKYDAFGNANALNPPLMGANKTGYSDLSSALGTIYNGLLYDSAAW